MGVVERGDVDPLLEAELETIFNVRALRQDLAASEEARVAAVKKSERLATQLERAKKRLEPATAERDTARKIVYKAEERLTKMWTATGRVEMPDWLADVFAILDGATFTERPPQQADIGFAASAWSWDSLEDETNLP